MVHPNEQSLKIQTHLCQKLEVRVPKNNSNNDIITAVVYLKFNIRVINFLGS